MRALSTRARSEARTISGYEAVLCDLDGCLISGDRPLAGAAALAERLGERLFIVSNNSSDTQESMSSRLEALGLVVAPERIVLAGVETLPRLAATRPAARTFLCAAAPLRDYAARLGLHLVAAGEPADAAVLARDPDFDLARLEAFVAAVQAGTALLVTNLDTSHPGPGGASAPETGALLAALQAILPGVAFECIGKPAPALFGAALARAGVAADRALFVGDNPATDGAGAAAVGIVCRLVTPGVGVAQLIEEDRP